MTASVTWHSFDLKTGTRGPQLVTDKQGSIARIIGEPTDLSGLGVACWLDGAPVPGWDAATLPGRTMLVALDEENRPVWGGMVLRRRADAGAWVQVDLATLEAYFDRRYVTNHTYETNQGIIVNGVLTSDVIPTGVQFIVDYNPDTANTPANPKRDRTYLDDEDKTALSVLQELMSVQGGPEFTVDLEWANADQSVLNRIVRVKTRIEATAETRERITDTYGHVDGIGGRISTARFEMPGSVTGFEYVEDYTADNGANDVMAVSSGEGDARPKSAHQVATDLIAAGWVKYEHRFTPSTSITNVQTLNNHAARELDEMRDGLMELTLEANLDDAPRFGVDFHLGDYVTAVLTCPRFPEQVGPDGDLVPGYTKTVRCMGIEIDYDARTIKPRLLEVG